MSDNVYERLIDTLMRIGGAVPVYKCEEFSALVVVSVKNRSRRIKWKNVSSRRL